MEWEAFVVRRGRWGGRNRVEISAVGLVGSLWEYQSVCRVIRKANQAEPNMRIRALLLRGRLFGSAG